MSITISHPDSILKGFAGLPLSKSESNRILIIQALSKGKISWGNLSDARDTKLLQTALAADATEIDAEDAGTAMRFLTAYYCATNQHKILTGSTRMQERPIAVLIDALRDIGFAIRYLKKDGFPPLEITPSDLSSLKSEVEIAGNVSSQYISALMMAAPVLTKGLTIHFSTPLVSKPYISLTVALMKEAGIESAVSDSKIQIEHQSFQTGELKASADWSSASYWFSMAALSQQMDIFLKDLTLNSYQGDKQIAEWGKYFGVEANQQQDGILLHSDNPGHLKNPVNPGLHFDFTDTPDLAQTVIVLCAARNIKATFTGMESLRIKETDRITALQNELVKFGIKLEACSEGKFQLAGNFVMSHQHIKTYNDHRMAMAFAPLALLGTVTIENPEVVEKSYPDFWNEMERAGFEIISNTLR